jgi:hypothetical protein
MNKYFAGSRLQTYFCFTFKLVIVKSNFHLLFYLRKQKNYKGGPMAVYMRITVDSKRAEMSAGRECDPTKWNNHAGRAIGTKEEIKSLNNYLDSLQTKVRNAQILRFF